MEKEEILPSYYFLPPYTFLGIKNRPLKEADIAIIPFPYDSTTTVSPGTRFGPHAILTASRQCEFIDPVTKKNIFMLKMTTLDEILLDKSSSIKAIERIEDVIKTLLNNNIFPVSIGGEHTIALGAIKAVAQHYKNVSVIHFDAHGDRRPEFDDAIHSHATVMYHASEYVDTILSLGLRSICQEDLDFLKERSQEVVFAHEFSYEKAIQAIKSKIPLGSNLYISFDLDYFDPSLVPSVGTPVPGGPQWNETQKLLTWICQNYTLLGLDVVELSPTSLDSVSPTVAAKLIQHILFSTFLNDTSD